MTKRTWVRMAAVLGLALAVSGGAAAPGRWALAQDAAPAGPQATVGTAFTYQGRLTDGGSAANGSYDFEFKLYDALGGGSQVGSTVTVGDQAVSAGLFTVALDFGAVFAGDAHYLEIGVRPGASTDAYTALSPRQEVTAAPYALYSLKTAVHNHWGESWSGGGTGLTLSGYIGLSGTGTAMGVQGISAGQFGVVGQSTSGGGVSGTSTTGYGVYGSTGSGTIAGVHGVNSGTGPGVKGIAASSTNAGVDGSNSGSGPGVLGASSSGIGVSGTTGSSNPGVRGSNTGAGPAIVGASSSGSAFSGTNSSSTNAAVHGSNSSNGPGVKGESTGGYAVYGVSSGRGVYGANTAGGPGVYGSSVTGYGVQGYSTSSTSAAVYGINQSGGYGVEGESQTVAAGTRGRNTSSGPGLLGESSTGYGVKGLSTSASAAVYGESTSSGPGVEGKSASGSGVYGKTSVNNINFAGVEGNSTGSSAGVRGSSTSGYGIYGISYNDKAAVHGLNNGTGDGIEGKATGSGDGVEGSSTEGFGVHGYVASTLKAGVWGDNTSSGPGVYGTGTSGYGVHGKSNSGAGVYGLSDSGYGVHGKSTNSYAGYFEGNVHVTGTLTKFAGSFRIDHPLDPENRYLSHSFVESPDMMNVYNGNVTLDGNGEAWVELPEWFEALNGGAEHRADYRYQLTPIGAPGPNLYIAAEITGNRFRIAGGAAGLKVSWQVTGIRHDAYAEANRIPVEEAKPPEEQGTYLHPAAFGQPAEKGLDYRDPLGGGE